MALVVACGNENREKPATGLLSILDNSVLESQPDRESHRIIGGFFSFQPVFCPQSVWIVVSQKSAKSIRDEISTIVDSGDGLLVLNSGVEAAWRGVGSGTDWLKENL